MGRTHSFIIIRILVLLYGGSEASIYLNEFKALLYDTTR